MTFSANAVDDVTVAGVQFKIDGVALGAEDTSAPYAVSWNTTTAANGVHVLTAVARDSSGNTAESLSVNVVVLNTVAQVPVGLVAAYSFDDGSGTTAADSFGQWKRGHAGEYDLDHVRQVWRCAHVQRHEQPGEYPRQPIARPDYGHDAFGVGVSHGRG